MNLSFYVCVGHDHSSPGIDYRPRHQTEIVSGALQVAGAHIAYTRAMSEHRCIPKKRPSTHTMHFKWHHKNLSKMTMSHCKQITNEDTHGLFRFFNTKNAQNTKIVIWKARWNMISPVFFTRALTIFSGPCPCGPHPGDGVELQVSLWVRCH